MTYYNFNNLYALYDTDDYILRPINYEFFENNMDCNYEIIAYDKIKINYNTIQSQLRMLKNTYSVN